MSESVSDLVERPSEPAQRIAVVAVHGVADQQPGETARSVCNILQRLESSAGTRCYGEFEERQVRIGVRPLIARASTPPCVDRPAKRADRVKREFDLRAEFLKECSI